MVSSWCPFFDNEKGTISDNPSNSAASSESMGTTVTCFRSDNTQIRRLSSCEKRRRLHPVFTGRIQRDGEKGARPEVGLANNVSSAISYIKFGIFVGGKEQSGYEAMKFNGTPKGPAEKILAEARLNSRDTPDCHWFLGSSCKG